MRAIYVIYRLCWVALQIGATSVACKLFRSSRAKRDEQIGRHLKASFVALSGAFVKFGQVLAMRPDLLSEPIIQQLQTLLDDVPPESSETAFATIRSELRVSNISDAFASIEATPIGAASFATVFRATLLDGTPIAVKVQRRGVDQRVARDLVLLRRISGLIDLTGLLKRFNLSEFVGAFARWTTEELDYEREGRHVERLRAIHACDPEVLIPQIYWRYASRRVLTMDLISGKWISQISGDINRSAADHDVYRWAARKIFNLIAVQVFEHGIFHSDPHPGNICITDDRRIGLIDFGMVGFLDEQTRSIQLQLLASVQKQDLEGAYEAVKEILEVPPDAKLSDFRRQFEKNVRDWSLLHYQPTLPASAKTATRLLLLNFAAARESGLSFSSISVRYYRTFIVLDPVLLALDPDFPQLEEIENYLLDRYDRQRDAVIRDFAETGAFGLRSTLLEAFYGLPVFRRRVSAALKNLATPDEVIDASFSKTQARIGSFIAQFARLWRIAGLALIVFYLAAWLGRERRWDLQPLLDSIGVNQSLFLISGIVAIIIGYILSWWSKLLWIRAYTPTRDLTV